MVGTLRDLTKNTMIGSLPNIINWNNEQIRKEFDNIYDFENDSLVKSLNVPKGFVTAHTGTFVNLRTRTLTIDDPSSLESLVIKIKHNDTALRLESDFAAEGLTFDPEKDAAHDMAMIKGLIPEINAIKKDIRELWIRVTPKNEAQSQSILQYLNGDEDVAGPGVVSPSPAHPGGFGSSMNARTIQAESDSDSDIVVDVNYLDSLDADTTFYGYSQDVYNSNVSDFEDKLKTAADKTDVLNNFRCQYIVANSKYVKVNNSLPVIINATARGQIINLIFEKTEENSDFVIVIKRSNLLKDYTMIRFNSSEPETIFAKLICADIDPYMGSTWRVLARS